MDFVCCRETGVTAKNLTEITDENYLLTPQNTINGISCSNEYSCKNICH